MLTTFIVGVVCLGGGIYLGGTSKAAKIEAELKAFETSAVADVKAVIAAIKKHL